MVAAATINPDESPASLSILNDQNALPSQQTAAASIPGGIGSQKLPFPTRFTPATGAAMGHRRPAKERKRQAENFANTCHDLLTSFRAQMGLNKPKPAQISGDTADQPTNGQTNGKDGETLCEADSRQSARAELKEAAGILVNLTRAWDTALERHRVLSGVPDPGCRRPGEPVPKARKPTNRAPDSLACGPDTPTGSVPPK